ncbi:GerMN domain-containing protein [Paenibacillus sp. GSMTC-2017]|uniref:GerMN domain-containing protein n=1 Tax=Paenibacillus sp. GSMTC-2017 TaxID=2794350 RepID=UPI0018D770C7|nr:GerMN domain-containing protein [Paenibacillus sp. GSMTC-2017]MBH5317198.1 GerMN domain-containing protein [Paenibacillus sp. GSMTC-2017]
MIQKKWIRHTAFVALLVLPVFTAGCGLFSQQTSKSIDPPQVEVTEEVEGEPTGQVTPDGETGSRLTIYLQDSNGYVAPVAVPLTLAENETAAQKALEMMVDNGAYASQLPADFRALIPQGTQVLSYQYDKELKVAKVDLSKAFVDYNAQDERAIVEAITWTLTAMPGIEGVELSVEGELLQEMPVAAYPIEGKLTRAIGINIEVAEGVNVSSSSPVTLYFSAQTQNQEQYYVPVTRLISRSDSQVHAAMEQLIEGPLNKKELTSVILPDVEVTEIVEKDGVVTIDLQDEAYVTGQQIPSEMLQAVVLSLTENSDAETVQIRVNGETNLVDENNNSYSEPVGRKHHINALKS